MSGTLRAPWSYEFSLLTGPYLPSPSSHFGLRQKSPGSLFGHKLCLRLEGENSTEILAGWDVGRFQEVFIQSLEARLCQSVVIAFTRFARSPQSLISGKPHDVFYFFPLNNDQLVECL